MDVGVHPEAVPRMNAGYADSSDGFCTRTSRINAANVGNNATIHKVPTRNRKKDETMIFWRFIHQLAVQEAVSPTFGIVPQYGIHENNELLPGNRGFNSR